MIYELTEEDLQAMSAEERAVAIYDHFTSLLAHEHPELDQKTVESIVMLLVPEAMIMAHNVVLMDLIETFEKVITRYEGEEVPKHVVDAIVQQPADCVKGAILTTLDNAVVTLANHFIEEPQVEVELEEEFVISHSKVGKA